MNGGWPASAGQLSSRPLGRIARPAADRVPAIGMPRHGRGGGMTRLSLVSMIAAVLVLVGGCDPLRGPVVDERDDGVIRGTLSVSRGRYREGETVEVVF